MRDVKVGMGVKVDNTEWTDKQREAMAKCINNIMDNIIDVSNANCENTQEEVMIMMSIISSMWIIFSEVVLDGLNMSKDAKLILLKSIHQTQINFTNGVCNEGFEKITVKLHGEPIQYFLAL